ncbi:hypothetical protein LshimejAT787_0100130 [Lyophyllum shimeji]|uniref:Uncharacterized protein n=1 Tax=Lyophyllum shimeji TaxID=47721 RepID=A0A9P3UHK4_LYOSH|nr:hypothetical protein LshimejAT787_0100130 [Lyophyllum shimeji]
MRACFLQRIRRFPSLPSSVCLCPYSRNVTSSHWAVRRLACAQTRHDCLESTLPRLLPTRRRSAAPPSWHTYRGP